MLFSLAFDFKILKNIYIILINIVIFIFIFNDVSCLRLVNFQIDGLSSYELSHLNCEIRLDEHNLKIIQLISLKKINYAIYFNK